MPEFPIRFDVFPGWTCELWSSSKTGRRPTCLWRDSVSVSVSLPSGLNARSVCYVLPVAVNPVNKPVQIVRGESIHKGVILLNDSFNRVRFKRGAEGRGVFGKTFHYVVSHLKGGRKECKVHKSWSLGLKINKII